MDGISLSVAAGSVRGLVGESGSGKSTVVLALLGLLGPAARVKAERLAFDGHDLLANAPALRGRRIGVVFQDTAAALNPALTIGSQVIEPMRVHLGTEQRVAWQRGTDLLAEMGIPRPAQVMQSYPHQLSGGMKQRVGIAAALASEPDLLLLDEPTTALDVTIEAQILALLDELRSRRNLAMLLVSHNLGIVDRLCDTVSVLYAGRMVESGTTGEVLHRPRHPYTKGLLAALPRPDRPHAGRLAPIQGNLPDLTAPDPGCNFRPRCAFAGAGCERPQLQRGDRHQVSCHRVDAVADLPWPAEPLPPTAAPVGSTVPLVEARELSIRFDSGGWLQRLLGKAGGVLAVDRVSVTIRNGEVLGLVGESGCGKSTLGRLLSAAAAGARRHAALRLRGRWRQARRSFPATRPGRLPELRHRAQSTPDRGHDPRPCRTLVRDRQHRRRCRGRGRSPARPRPPAAFLRPALSASAVGR